LPNDVAGGPTVAVGGTGSCLTSKGVAATGIAGNSGKGGGGATSNIVPVASGELVTGEGGGSSGVVTSGGNGWTKLRLTFGG